MFRGRSSASVPVVESVFETTSALDQESVIIRSFEANLRNQPRWTYGLPVVGAIRDNTLFAYYDPVRQQIVTIVWTAEHLEEDVLRRLPAHDIVDHLPSFPAYKSRHHVEAYRRLEWDTGYHVPHHQLDLGVPTGWFHTWEIDIQAQLLTWLDTWARTTKSYGDGACVLSHDNQLLRPEMLKSVREDPDFDYLRGEALLAYLLHAHGKDAELASPAHYEQTGLKLTHDGRWWMSWWVRHQYKGFLKELRGLPPVMRITARGAYDIDNPTARQWLDEHELSGELQRAFNEMMRINKLAIRHTRVETCVDPTMHEPPRAEAGRLVLYTDTVAEAVDELMQLGLVDAVKQRDSRHDQLGIPLRTSSVDVRQLRNRRIYHAMTGCKTHAEALSRFNSIVAWGGIYSGAERRVRDIVVKTLSPKGDLVTGIDYGVAATVSTRPYVKSPIVFELKPSALERSTWWASERDYGWEDNPWDWYSAYGARLGQRHLYGHMPTQGAHRHFRSLNDKSKNEIFFPYMIPFSDIAVVRCDPQLFVSVRSAVMRLPEHCRPDVSFII